MVWLLAACTRVPACPCDRIAVPADPVVDDYGLRQLLVSVLAEAYPGLVGVEIDVAPVEDLAYFRAWVELDTADLDDGRLRRHTLHYDPVALDDPLGPAALAAVLVHEVGHVEDYVGMDSDALVDFAVWYATEDPLTSEGLAAYERATDEEALERGCAAGLAEAREWIYDHAEPAVLAEKVHNYYTPDEIAAWSETHAACEE